MKTCGLRDVNDVNGALTNGRATGNLFVRKERIS